MRLAGFVLVGLTTTFMGFLLARGSKLAYVLLTGLLLVVAITLVADHMFTVLLFWVGVEGLAYPWIRYPLHHNLITFDRFVLPALGVALLLVARPRLARPARNVLYALGAFVLVYGLRALLTDPLPTPPNYSGINFADTSPYQNVADWLDNALLPFFAFAVAAYTVTRERWQALATALTFLGVTIAALALLEWVFGFTLAQLSNAIPFVDDVAGVVRVSGPYADPSAYGGVMVVCIAVTMYWLQQRKAYVLGFIALAIEVVGVVPNFTKTVWAGSLLAIVISAGLRRRISSRTLLVTAYVAVGVFLVYATVKSNPVVTARVHTSTSGNFLARVGDYVQAIYIFQHWPLFGAGIGQFIAAQQFVPSVTIADVVATPSAHNTFLSVLAEAGAVGFSALAALVYTIGKLIRRWRRTAVTEEEVLFGACVLAACVSYFVLSLTLVEIYYPPGGTFLALVLGAMAGRLTESVRKAERAPRSPQNRRPTEGRPRPRGRGAAVGISHTR